MQNDGFQDNLDGVQLNAHFLAVIGHLGPKTNSRVLTVLLKRLLSRQKRFYMTETFYRILFSFLYNYMFLSYEYIFPYFKFADKVLTRTCQLIIYNTFGSNVSCFPISLLLPFLTIRATSHGYFGTCICK